MEELTHYVSCHRIMKVFAENRKARNSYEFLEFIEAGVSEIMFSPRPSDREVLERLDDQVVAVFQ